MEDLVIIVLAEDEHTLTLVVLEEFEVHDLDGTSENAVDCPVFAVCTLEGAGVPEIVHVDHLVFLYFVVDRNLYT